MNDDIEGRLWQASIYIRDAIEALGWDCVDCCEPGNYPCPKHQPLLEALKHADETNQEARRIAHQLKA